LQAIYPEYVPDHKPLRYWKDTKNQRAFFDQLAVKLNIQSLEDWDKVTPARVQQEEGASFISRYYNGSLRQGTQ
jgi:hypothetical protein